MFSSFSQLDWLFNELNYVVLNSRFSKIAGAIVTLICLLKLSSLLYKAFKTYVWAQLPFNRVDLVRRYGKWVLVSGGTDGIGLAMAKDLARRGHSLVILGRNKTKLANVQKVLADEPGVGEIVTHEIDLSDSSLENYDKLRADIERRDIGILINSAGVHYPELKRYRHRELGQIQNQVNVNVLSYTYLTRMVLPVMVERRRGMIINISSVLGYCPSPYLALYGPCKAFIDAFSKNLQIEYASHPIDFVNIAPGPVDTKMVKDTVKPNLFIPFNKTPEDYALTALNVASTRLTFTCGSFSHEVMYFASKLANVCSIYNLIGRILITLGCKHNEISPILNRRKTSKC